jgi:hypothetical protein
MKNLKISIVFTLLVTMCFGLGSIIEPTRQNPHLKFYELLATQFVFGMLGMLLVAVILGGFYIASLGIVNMLSDKQNTEN